MVEASSDVASDGEEAGALAEVLVEVLAVDAGGLRMAGNGQR